MHLFFSFFPCLLPAQFIEKNFAERRKLLEKGGESIVGFYPNDLALVKKAGKCDYIRADGKQITPFVYEKGYLFNREYALVKKAGKWGILKESGQEIAPCVYEQIWESLEWRSSSQDFEESYYTRMLHNGVFWAKKDSKWGLIDSLGKVLYPFEIEHIADTNRHNECRFCKFYFGDELFLMAAKKDGKWSMIDATGALVLPHQYVDIYVENDFIFAQTEKAMYVFDSNLQLKYTSERFKDVNIRVLRKGNFLFFLETGATYLILFNEKQEKVWESQDCLVIEVVENKGLLFFQVETKNDKGLLDAHFQQIIAPECKHIHFAPDAIFAIKDNCIAVFSSTGKEILPCIYKISGIDNQFIVLKDKEKTALFDVKNERYKVPFQTKYHAIKYLYETKEFLLTGYDSTRIAKETNEKSDYANYNGGITKTYCTNISHPEVMALMDSNFRPILPAVYDELYYDRIGKYYLLGQNKKGYTVLDSNKHVAYRFDSLKGIYLFYKEGKMGIFHESLLTKTPTLYNQIGVLHRSLDYFVATRDNIHLGIIDNKGIEKQPFIFEKTVAGDRFIYAYKKNKIYIFDENIDLLGTLPQKRKKNLMGLSFVSWTKNKGKWGVKDKAGKIIIPFIYDKVQWIQNEEDSYIEDGRFHAFEFRSKPYNDTLERHFDIGFDMRYNDDNFWDKQHILDDRRYADAHLVEKNGMIGG